MAQTPDRIELVNADVSEFNQNLNAKATRLLGNVIFKHENAFMYCDSAYLYREDNRLEAFNNIRIKQGDTLTLTGKRLLYDGNTKMAQVFESVVLNDRKMTLHTNRLDYDMNTDIAYYTDSANIVDEENTLTSRIGYFYSNSHDLYFRKDVLLINPKYRMNGDTLRYNSISKIAYFLGPTYIRSNDNLIYCEDGWYNTGDQTSSFHKNSYLQTRNQVLRGDSVTYNRNLGIGKVFSNVSISDTINKIIINGNYGEYHELTDSSWVTGKALMTQVFDKDSLFIHGDTLLAIGDPERKDTSEKKRNLFAFHDVHIYKQDLQGACDSLAYTYKDSCMRMFYLPVLWSGLNQLTSDSVTIQTANSGIDKIFMNSNAFITSRADSTAEGVIDSLRFNQVRGKNMTGFFKDNKLYKIDVQGNGQAIYYAKNKTQKNFAVNRAECSDLVLLVEENKVQDISLLNDPDGTLYPINELKTTELRLKGFSWLDEKRPKSKNDFLNLLKH